LIPQGGQLGARGRAGAWRNLKKETRVDETQVHALFCEIVPYLLQLILEAFLDREKKDKEKDKEGSLSGWVS
jgi:hypothetical protein